MRHMWITFLRNLRHQYQRTAKVVGQDDHVKLLLLLHHALVIPAAGRGGGGGSGICCPSFRPPLPLILLVRTSILCSSFILLVHTHGRGRRDRVLDGPGA